MTRLSVREPSGMAQAALEAVGKNDYQAERARGFLSSGFLDDLAEMRRILHFMAMAINNGHLVNPPGDPVPLDEETRVFLWDLEERMHQHGRGPGDIATVVLGADELQRLLRLAGHLS